jgi:hypothetical protein
MDAARTREHVNEHTAAVERANIDAAVADFAEDLRPLVPQIAQAVPQPVTTARCSVFRQGTQRAWR